MRDFDLTTNTSQNIAPELGTEKFIIHFILVVMFGKRNISDFIVIIICLLGLIGKSFQ